MADTAAYHQALRRAREVALGLTRRQEERLVELIRAWADELTARVTAGVGTEVERDTLAVVRELIDQMVVDLATDTREGILLTARELETIHARATTRLIASSEVTGLAVGLEGVGAAAAQSVIAREELSAAFATLRSEFTDMADRAIQDAILRGATTDQLARRLRLMMVGSEDIPDRLLLDQRRIGRETLEALGMDASPENVARVRQQARRVRMRAERIGRTEIRTAEHEAGVQLATESPVVAGVQWTLSARHPEVDICDDIAGTDWYGMGEGVFPPERVPGVPHPNDLCNRRHLLLPPEQWGLGRGPVPGLRTSPGEVAENAGRPPSEIDQLRRAFQVGEARRRVAA